MEDHVIRLALEWWAASGRRTKARLAEIVAHFAKGYGIPPERVPVLVDKAWEGIPAWKIAAHAPPNLGLR